jgi:tryptophan synthase beta chain
MTKLKAEAQKTRAGIYAGTYGGQYIPETLMTELEKVDHAFHTLKDDPAFKAELHDLLVNYANRPSLLYYAKNMTEDLGGAKIYLKREDLNHTGAHKINNVIGQALLAKHLGKKRLIAETGAGQHGVATATIAALFGMECEIFMGKEDTDRQKLNVYRMELLGAKVHPVTTGSMVLKDAINAALQEWATRSEDTFYVMGSAVGPYPFPEIVKHFQSVISKESKAQLKAKENTLPDMVVACVGGGSNAIGSFADYIDDPSVKLVGVEAAGKGVNTDQTAATIERGSVGIFHGMKSLFLQNEDGQINPVYSISAGLDYPGVGPEHAALAKEGRAQYVGITDDESVQAFEYIAKQEGIVAAIESCHAIAYVEKIAPTMRKDQIIVCTLSGRGDKDVASIAKYKGVDIDE